MNTTNIIVIASVLIILAIVIYWLNSTKTLQLSQYVNPFGNSNAYAKTKN